MNLEELRARRPDLARAKSEPMLLLRQLAFESERGRRDIEGRPLISTQLSTLWSWTNGRRSCRAEEKPYLACVAAFRALETLGILRTELLLHARYYSFAPAGEEVRRELLAQAAPAYHPEYWKKDDVIDDPHCPRCRAHLYAIKGGRGAYRCPEEGDEWEFSREDCSECDADVMVGEKEWVPEEGRLVERRVYVCTKCSREFHRIPESD